MSRVLVVICCTAVLVFSFNSSAGPVQYIRNQCTSAAANRASARGEHTQALALRERLMVDGGMADDPVTLFDVARDLLCLDRYREAQAYLQKIVNSDHLSKQQQEQAQVHAGHACFGQKKYEDAQTHYEKALEYNADNEIARKQLEEIKRILAEQQQQQKSSAGSKQEGKTGDAGNSEQQLGKKEGEQKGEQDRTEHQGSAAQGNTNQESGSATNQMNQNAETDESGNHMQESIHQDPCNTANQSNDSTVQGTQETGQTQEESSLSEGDKELLALIESNDARSNQRYLMRRVGAQQTRRSGHERNW